MMLILIIKIAIFLIAAIITTCWAIDRDKLDESKMEKFRDRTS